MIGIINYGLGNVQAFHDLYKRLNIESTIVSCPADVRKADKLLLPGVGSFDWAMHRLNESGLRDALEEMVLGQKIPILGVCVGMQMLGHRSEEGRLPGLGWIEGEVHRFPHSVDGNRLQLPHMGWNDIAVKNGCPLLRGLESNVRFYFLHSYFMVPANKSEEAAVTEYAGMNFTSVVCRKNIYGVQFHPEKSHGWGLQLLKNFAEMPISEE